MFKRDKTFIIAEIGVNHNGKLNIAKKMEEVNLKAMRTLEEEFKFPVGLSDHTLGIEISLVVVALGARVIEKHITLSQKMKGPDHFASLEPKPCLIS